MPNSPPLYPVWVISKVTDYEFDIFGVLSVFQFAANFEDADFFGIKKREQLLIKAE